MSKELKPMKFWSQKILPLVYDDSLSYYEVLCKVVNKINEIIEALQAGIVSEFVKQLMAKALLDAVYDEEEEMIELTLSDIDGGDVHVYDPTTKTMIIQDK